MEPVIATDSLTRKFSVGGNDIYALQDISLSIEPNTLTLFQGPSGSGKTTLLNLMGTLDTPSTGHIFFKDRDITDLPEKSRDTLRRSEMGFIFQSVALISKMSAFENVDFALRINGMEPLEREGNNSASPSPEPSLTTPVSSLPMSPPRNWTLTWVCRSSGSSRT